MYKYIVIIFTESLTEEPFKIVFYIFLFINLLVSGGPWFRGAHLENRFRKCIFPLTYLSAIFSPCREKCRLGPSD